MSNDFCCFIGGSVETISLEVKEQTRKIILDVIDLGCRKFLMTYYGEWNILCATVLRELQKCSFDIEIICNIIKAKNSDSYKQELEETFLFDDVIITEAQSRTELQRDIILRSKEVICYDQKIMQNSNYRELLKNKNVLFLN